MLGNTTNNNYNERNVNTRIKTLYGDLSALQLSYWNENMSIKINPFVSMNGDGVRTYDYNRRINTALTQDKASALKTELDRQVLPKIKEVNETSSLSSPVSIAIPVGAKGTVIGFEYKSDEKGVPSLYLVLYTSVSQDGKATPENTFKYKFNKTEVYTNYNSETGEHTIGYVESEFSIFYDKLKHMPDILGTAAHTIAIESEYKKAPKNNSYQGYNNNSSYSYNNQQQQPNTQQYASSTSAPVNSFNADSFLFGN